MMMTKWPQQPPQTKRSREWRAAFAVIACILCVVALATQPLAADESYNGEEAAESAPTAPLNGDDLTAPGTGMVEAPETPPPPTMQAEEDDEEALHIPGEEAFLILLALALLGGIFLRVYTATKQEPNQPKNPEANTAPNVKETGAESLPKDSESVPRDSTPQIGGDEPESSERSEGSTDP